MRQNGLRASSFVAVADVDPRIADQLLDLLAFAHVAAYAEPVPGRVGVYRDHHVPTRPIDRLWVDREATGPAREVLDRSLAHLHAELETAIAEGVLAGGTTPDRRGRTAGRPADATPAEPATAAATGDEVSATGRRQPGEPLLDRAAQPDPSAFDVRAAGNRADGPTRGTTGPRRTVEPDAGGRTDGGGDVDGARPVGDARPVEDGPPTDDGPAAALGGGAAPSGDDAAPTETPTRGSSASSSPNPRSTDAGTPDSSNPDSGRQDSSQPERSPGPGAPADGSAGPQHSDGDLDQAVVDARWRDIVARWDGPPALGGGPVQASPPAGGWSPVTPVPKPPDQAPTWPLAPPRPGDRRRTDRGPIDPARRRDHWATDHPAGPSDPRAYAPVPADEHFSPPPPTPHPPLEKTTRLGWAGLVAGLLLLVVVVAVGSDTLPRWLPLVGVALLVGGFVALVSRLHRSSADEDDDDPDDGAVV